MAANQGVADQAGKPVTFRSTTAVIVWVLWLLFAVGNWIDLAVQGRDRTAVVAASVLLLATGIGYVAAQRPRVVADHAGITVKNPLRDHRIGWAGVARVDLADVLRVHCDLGPGQPKVISAWAVHYSRRRQFAAEAKARRAARRGGADRSSFGFGLPQGRSLAYAAAASATGSAEEADAERAVRLLSEWATTARAEDVLTENPARATPLTSAWSIWAIAAVVIPALILLVVALA
jgi:hypothetical protein